MDRYPQIPSWAPEAPDDGPAATGHRALLFVLRHDTGAGIPDAALLLAQKAATIAIAARDIEAGILAAVRRAQDTIAATLRARRRLDQEAAQEAPSGHQEAEPLPGGALVPRTPAPALYSGRSTSDRDQAAAWIPRPPAPARPAPIDVDF